MTKPHKNNTAQFKAQRLRVLNRDAHTCYYCGANDATHVDHVVPKAKGGGDELDNLVAACARCNLRKGSKSQGLFLALTSAPPVFSSFLSLTRSVIHQDSPFTTRPVQEGDQR